MTNNFNNSEDPFNTNNDPFNTNHNQFGSQDDPFATGGDVFGSTSFQTNNNQFNTDNNDEDPFNFGGSQDNGNFLQDANKQEPFANEFEKDAFNGVGGGLFESPPNFNEEVRDIPYKDEDVVVPDPFKEPTTDTEFRPDPFKMAREQGNQSETYREDISTTGGVDFTSNNNTQETENKVSSSKNTDSFYSGFSYGMSILGFIYILQTILGWF